MRPRITVERRKGESTSPPARRLFLAVAQNAGGGFQTAAPNDVGWDGVATGRQLERDDGQTRPGNRQTGLPIASSAQRNGPAPLRGQRSPGGGN